MPMPLRNAAASSRGNRVSKALEVFSIAANALHNAHVAKDSPQWAVTTDVLLPKANAAKVHARTDQTSNII